MSKIKWDSKYTIYTNFFFIFIYSTSDFSDEQKLVYGMDVYYPIDVI